MPGKEHEDLKMRCLPWFACRATRSGIRGSTEVYINQGYRADVAAIGSFQHRFLLGYADYAGGAIKTNLRQNGIEPQFTCVFEVKVSRADFHKTFGNGGNRIAPVANMHWIVTPRGLIQADESPEFWGLLEASGRGLAERKKPLYQDQTPNVLYSFAYNILLKPRSTRCWRCSSLASALLEVYDNPKMVGDLIRSRHGWTVKDLKSFAFGMRE